METQLQFCNAMTSDNMFEDQFSIPSYDQYNVDAMWMTGTGYQDPEMIKVLLAESSQLGVQCPFNATQDLYSQNYDMSSHSRFLTSDHPSHGDLNYAQSPPSSLIDYHHSTSDSVNDHMNISSFLLEPLPDCSMDSVYSSNSQWIPSPSASHTDMHRCQWPNCNEILRGSSVPCIRRHLHQSKAHLAADAYALADGKVTCLWPDCGKQMKLVSLPKHIANCHLAAGMVKCDRCPAVLSTSDALKRHHEKHCPSVPERKGRPELMIPGSIPR